MFDRSLLGMPHIDVLVAERLLSIVHNEKRTTELL